MDRELNRNDLELTKEILRKSGDLQNFQTLVHLNVGRQLSSLTSGLLNSAEIRGFKEVLKELADTTFCLSLKYQPT